jgi:hypothetical protein
MDIYLHLYDGCFYQTNLVTVYIISQVEHMFVEHFDLMPLNNYLPKFDQLREPCTAASFVTGSSASRFSTFLER